MKIKALLIENGHSNESDLSSLLKMLCGEKLQILKKDDNLTSGVIAMYKLKPDLVFIDLGLLNDNNKDAWSHIDATGIKVVLVGSCEKNAIKLFNKFSSAYCLMRPLVKAEIETIVDKVFERVLERNKMVISGDEALRKIRIPTKEGFKIVNIKDVVYCKGEGNYTHFYLYPDNQKIMVCRTLKYYHLLLDDFGFIRINKSNIINVNFINEYRRSDGGFVLLSTGESINVSVKYRNELLKIFQRQSIG